METSLQKIADLLELQTTAFPWEMFFSGIALLASIITVGILLKERFEKNRPYLQISFELVRSSLACLILKNTGTVPLSILSLEFGHEFTCQLPETVQKKLQKKSETDITIFPNRQWVMSFDINVCDIFSYNTKYMTIHYTYKDPRKRKKYQESEIIDIEEYEGMLIYISEIDEIKRGIELLNKSIIVLAKSVTPDKIEGMHLGVDIVEHSATIGVDG